MKGNTRTGWFGWGVMLLAALACSLSNPTPASWVLTPTAEALAAQATSGYQTRAAISNQAPPIPTLTPSSPPLPQSTPTFPPNHLNDLGPWLIYPTEAGRALVVRNADGSGATRLPLPDPLLDVGDLTNGMAPYGGWLAVRTGRREGWADLAIQLIHLPDGKIQRLSPLVAPSLQDDNLVIQSVVWRDALRWSPDGHYLAFIAAVDGPSSDLYVYDVYTKTAQRLTAGSNQAATPFWSPDSQWVIAQEMDALANSSPDGWLLSNVWEVNLTTQETLKLYTPPPDSVGEVFMGWYSSGIIALYSQGSAGNHNLRFMDIEKNKMTPVFPGVFSQIAFDPGTHTFLYTLRENLESATGASPGLYQLLPDTNTTQLIEAGEWDQLAWSAKTASFIASGPQGTLVYKPGGSQVLFKNEPNGMASPNSKWQAGWGGESAGANAGLRLYQPTGQLMQTILQAPVQALTWTPDSSGFFALAGGQLYHFTFPELQPVSLQDGIDQGSFGGFYWMGN